MAEESMFWATNGTGDGSSSGYTQAQWFAFLRDVFMGATAEQGVVGAFATVSNNLLVSGSASPLTLQSGRAMVAGIAYRNTASKTLTVATPASDTGGRLVLRADWTAQTVRAFVLMNSVGVTSAPALTQVDGTTWEISLASFVIDTSGNIWKTAAKLSAGVTDERQFVQYNSALVKARQGDASDSDWDAPGSTTRIAGPTGIQAGAIEWTGGAADNGTIAITFPEAFVYTPLTFVSLIGNAPAVNAVVSALSTTGMTISWKDAGGATHTALTFGWLAIGRL